MNALSSSWLRRIPRTRLIRPGIAIGIVGMGAFALQASGTLADSDAALIAMGFDPERARLISALSIEALLVAVAVLATGLVRPPMVAGLVSFALLFRRAFTRETADAVAASGAAGRFDPTGWLLSLATLVITAVVIAWAAITLTLVVRRGLVAASTDVRALARSRGSSRSLARPIMAAAVVVALVTTLPVFVDMVNLEPDVHMRSGAALTGGLADAGSPAPLPSNVTTLSPSMGDQAGVVAPTGPSATTTGDPGNILSNARPWLSWRPNGQGTINEIQLAAPWTGGSATARLIIYLPPGYSAGAHRYPVIYEVPWGDSSWVTIGLPGYLDALTNSGAIAGHIVVFVSERGGPYADSECVDSYDGRENVETYVSTTVPAYIDAHYRTIAKPAARSVLGLSQGGYCAAMLVLRHPDVFGTAMAFSGYYQAAIGSPQTRNASLPFGHHQALIDAHSPILLASEVTSSRRAGLFFMLSADPSHSFYGPQYLAMAGTLRQAGIAVDLFPTPLGHSWAAPRAQLPEMLAALGQREAALSVFLR